MAPEKIESVHPLSPLQQGILFHSLYEPGAGLYIPQVLVHLRRPVQIRLLERAWRDVVERHAVLRVALRWKGVPEPVQEVHERVELPFDTRDVSILPVAERWQAWERYLEDVRRNGFDLTRSPLLRIGLFRFGEADSWFALSFFHVVSDGWSVAILLKEAFALYDAYASGDQSVPVARRPYWDFVQWLRDRDSSADEAFWRATLAGFRSPPALPEDDSAKGRQGRAESEVLLAAGIAPSLRDLADRTDLTLNTLVQGAWALLLSRISGSEDVVFGASRACRRGALEAAEEMIGLFTNTLPVRARVDPGMKLLPWLRGLREQWSAMRPHEHASSAQVREWSEVPPGSSLFDTIVNAQFGTSDWATSLGGKGSILEGSEARQISLTHYALSLRATASPELKLSIMYDRGRFEDATIGRMLGHLATLLEEMGADPDRRLSELGVLGAAERHLVLVEWSGRGGPAAAPPRACLHELVEAQTRRTPDGVAIVAGTAQVSYRALNGRANQLARALREAGVGPETRVGVCVGRGPDLVAAVLGVLKAGGAYVPLDPEYPRERLRYLLADCGAALVVSEAALVERLGVDRARGAAPTAPAAHERYRVLVLDEETARLAARPATDLAPRAQPANLAYLIYTSGSTGRPKGVAITHRSAAGLVAWALGRYAAADLAGVLAATSLCFDLSVFELFVPLAAGHVVVLAEDALALPALAAAAAVTLVNTVPSAMAELVRVGGVPASVRVVNLAGEALPRTLAEGVYGQGVREVVNLYAPSETTTYSTASVVARGGRAAPRIGRPIAGARVVVVDGAGAPVGVGVVGEVCIGGPGVARGYHARPARTAARFVPDPDGEPGARMYRTGDRARWSADGELEFAGRADAQVKVRGYRIEPGEIEAALRAHAGVRAAAVIAREDVPGDIRLVAYVVVDPTSHVSVEELRALLKGKLPVPMLPSAFAILERLPLTPNGKLDRNALLAIAPTRHEASAFLPPRTAVEERVAGIWAEVLGLERVGVHDDFFELGGHSLLATQVVSRLPGAVGVELPLRALFDAPTVAALAQRVEEAQRAGATSVAAPLARAPRDAPLALSFAQQRLWFLHQLEPESPVYNMPVALRLAGGLDVAALEWALGEIVRRHEALRTVFPSTEGRPWQRIRAAGAVELRVVDVSALAAPARERQAAAVAAAEARRRFDLVEGPLVRAQVVRLAEREHRLLLTLHHIVADGWSLGVLQRELRVLYGARVRGAAGAPLAAVAVQYADYAQWQRGWMRGAVLERQLAYWKGRLGGELPVVELPVDRARPQVRGGRGATVRGWVAAGMAAELRELGRREGATLFMTLLAGFAALVGRYGGQDDVVVGTPIANRNRPEIEGLIGFFVNTLVVRTDLGGDPSFRALLARVREATLGAYAHQDLPFEKLVEELQPARDLTRMPLCQVLFALQNAPPQPLDLPDLVISPLELDLTTTRFDLEMHVSESERGLELTLFYDTDLFDPVTIRRLVEHFRTLLDAACRDPELRLGELPLLTRAEDRQLIEWNSTTAPFSTEETVAAMVEAQVQRTPDDVALVSGEEHLTYRQLDALASTLADRLRRLGAGPETRVGVCLARSPHAMVAIFATLKAGAAHVPLDPSYPAARLAFMLDDTRAAVLITRSELLDRLPSVGVPSILLDGGIDDAAFGQSREGRDRPAPSATRDSPAYVIYTSGSTGAPKGVAMTHRSLCNLLSWQLGRPEIAPGAAVLQLASLNFDVSFQEIFSTWCSGGTLVLPSEDERRDPRLLWNLIAERRVGRLFVPFVALQELAEAASDAGELPSSLRALITAGERLRVTPAIRSLLERLPGCCLVNQYGPSESHVVTAQTLSGDPGQWPPLPAIGRPIANTQIHLLDSRLRLVPQGVAGELCIGGAILARGYFGRPDLTAERFIPDPFSPSPGARLYRTGDLARRGPSGELLFLGRIDNQVKLRGFRIEPGETESVLALHPSVREVAVALRGDPSSGGRLVAYVVSKGPAAVSSSALRQFASDRLPLHMVPSAIVFLDALPLTPSGKVDRRTLPTPGTVRPGLERPFVAPRGPLEEIVSEVWLQILCVDRVGVHDDFFDLGGHSLLATQVVSRLRESLGVDLPLRVFFERPTVALLAARLEELIRAEEPLSVPPLTRASVGGPLPLSFAQQRLWFIDQLVPGVCAYNMALALRIEGDLDRDALERALGEIVRRHEALRTIFSGAGGTPLQQIREPVPMNLPVADLGGLPRAARGAQALSVAYEESRRPFDLSRGPLFRAELLRLGVREHVFLMTMHHIVSDGWSLGVLMGELSMLYEAFAAGCESPLEELPVQYADYTRWQRGWLRDDGLHALLRYWKKRLERLAVLQLPTDRPRPSIQSFHGATETMLIPSPLVDELRAIGRRERATPFMTLLAAFQVLLSRYTGQEDVAVGSPIANRNRSEIEGLIGFFVNSLVVRCDLSGGPSFTELLARVRETALEAYAHQDLPFEKLVEELQPQRELGRNPLFQVSFAYQNAPMNALRLGAARVSPLPVEVTATRFDLELHAWEDREGLRLIAYYSTDLFERSTIRSLLGHYETLLGGIAADPQQRISQLPLLREEERRRILVEWNETAATFPEDATVDRLFEEQVERTPESVAINCGSTSLTYRELNRRSNRLAHHLRKQAVGPESRVGLLLERSDEMVAAVLGILKAGAAYVPLEPSTPPERLSFLLSDMRAMAVVTRDCWTERVARHGVRCISLDGEAGAIERQPETNPASRTVPENLAYVIYTSGSTGRPKGVMVPHRGLVNYLCWAIRSYAIVPGTSCPVHSPIGVDLTVTSLFAPLLAGGSLTLVPEAAGVESLAAAVRMARGFDLVKMTPRHVDLFRIELTPAIASSTARVLVVGGENLSAEALSFWREHAPAMRVVNEYGPTETVVGCCVHEIGRDDAASGAVPIGRPIANTRIVLLDRCMQPVPDGVAGELYVGGAGVARGYLDRADHTAERFLPDPFSAVPGARLYRTGDVARRLASGSLECLGRIDHQVKVRGHRVELEEIEAVLERHPAVARAAAAARGDGSGDRRLEAFVAVRQDHRCSETERAEWRSQHVRQWTALYDDLYASGTGSGDPGFQLAGWNSAATGEPFSGEEMREWVEGTTRRILSLAPESVLEIGCGTGLLLFRLAPRCRRYWATDISAAALDHIQRHLPADVLERTVLLRRPADDFNGVEARSFDLVVLNSVVQYFPDADYLTRVLEAAVQAVRLGGAIFVGDVRDLRLLEMYQAGVQSLRAAGRIGREELRERVRRALAREEELVLHPDFFHALSRHLGIRATVQLRRGRRHNELTRFRYDVVLRVEDGAAPIRPVAEFHWDDACEPASTIRELLARRDDPVLLIRGVPNARLRREVEIARWIDGEDGPATVADLSRAPDRGGGVDPEDLWTLATESSATAVIGPSQAPGLFDVCFLRGDVAERPPGTRLPVVFPAAAADAEPWRELASDPLKARAERALVTELRLFLRDRLPAFMLPSALTVLDDMPLTSAGKLDRDALPASDAARPDLEVDFLPPRTAVEERVAGIWAEVLGLERVGVHDDFFELGGHSLLATQVVSRLPGAVGVELPLRALFDAPTVAALAQRVEEAQRAGATSVAAPLARAPRDAPLALSFAQQRLWFLHQLEPESPVYNMPVALRLAGGLDVAALEWALGEIVRRHEALRTVFPSTEGRPWQRIRAAGAVELRVVDVSALAAPARERQAAAVAAAEARRRFDLVEGPLVRAQVVRLAEREHRLLLTLHHIVADGWSLGVLQRELRVLYGARVRGAAGAPLAAVAVQYADYAQWQRGWMRGAVLERQLAYWKGRLGGELPVVELPVDRARPQVRGGRGATVRGWVAAGMAAELRELGRREGATLFMTLLAGFAALVGRYGGQDDVVVGTPIANRNRPEIEGLIGFFVNTLVVRTDLGGDPSFRALLARVREATLGAYAHQDLPFEKLVEELQPARDLTRMPLCQVLFALQNAPPQPLDLPDLSVRPLLVTTDTARFDLSVSIVDTEEGLDCFWVYATDLFDAATIHRMREHFTTLLESIVLDPTRRLSQMQLMTAPERHRLVVESNATEADFPRGACVHELFEAQAVRSPDAVALTWEDGRLTYRQLNARSNVIARRLQQLGVRPETRVGVCLDRCPELVEAVLGILKAGGAYVPLDPSHPAERLAFQIDDAGVDVVLTRGQFLDRLAARRVRIVTLDAGGAPVLEGGRNLGTRMPQRSLAYVAFTSGSTGRPKGVMIEHESLVSYLAWFNGSQGRAGADAVPMISALAFDAVLKQLLAPLIRGDAVWVLPLDAATDPHVLLRALEGRKRICLNCVPSLWEGVLAALEDSKVAKPDLESLLLGGEPATAAALARSVALFPDLRLWNFYGPTETTANAAVGILTPASPSVIGRAIANVTIYLLDPHMTPVPAGVKGEVYVGGAGVARGYQDRPDLTASRFVPDPFGREPGARLYRTGDLARMRPDGSLELLGRIDRQVKIRGIRVEPGEVEGALAAHPSVREVAVVAHADGPGRRKLVAYLVPAGPEPPRVSELRELLQETLPAVMIPRSFVVLHALPRTPGGKVDRGALPPPDETWHDEERRYVPPRTPAERTLAEIWSSVLRIERVGIEDNFFALGGDSILSIQIVAKAARAGLRLTAKQLFEHQTIEKLARAAGTVPVAESEQGLVSGLVPLTPIQKRFFEQDLADPHHFNQAMLLAVPEQISPLRWARAVAALLAQHDALRLRFHRDPTGWRQVNLGIEEDTPFIWVDLSGLRAVGRDRALGDACARLQASLDLSRGPLLRVALFEQKAPAAARLLVVIHHLAVDWVSWRILLEDLERIAAGLIRGEEPGMAPKTTSYRQWAEGLAAYSRSEAMAAEERYWMQSLRRSGAHLPRDGTGPNTVVSLRSVSVDLDETDTHELLVAAPATHRAQIHEVLLTALATALQEWTGTAAHWLEIEGHGREEIVEGVDLSRTVGWFTSIHPVLLDLVGTDGPGEALKAVKEQLRSVPHRGIGYGLLRYLTEAAEPVERLVPRPAPQVSFNYVGQLDPEGTSLGWLAEDPGPIRSPRALRPRLLDVSGHIARGRLQVIFIYSENLHDRETVEGLAHLFLRGLRDLVEHCRSAEAAALTPSDFPLARLTQSQLDMILGGGAKREQP